MVESPRSRRGIVVTLATVGSRVNARTTFSVAEMHMGTWAAAALLRGRADTIIGGTTTQRRRWLTRNHTSLARRTLSCQMSRLAAHVTGSRKWLWSHCRVRLREEPSNVG